MNNAVTLSAEKRSAKIAKLQQYLDTVPKGARKTSLQTELEKFKSFTGLIAASEQEEQTTRGHVVPATTDARASEEGLCGPQKAYMCPYAGRRRLIWAHICLGNAWECFGEAWE